MNKKLRLDILLVNKNFFEDKDKAKRHIMAGVVFVDNQKVDKPGTPVSEDSSIFIKHKAIPYVSRGGLKLEKAINEFEIELNNKVCLDIGSSTGGFTDCMLKNKASKVYAIDVGYGQLDWKLRQDPRVVTMERTNIRNVTREQIKNGADFASIDVSFISLKLVLPVAKELLNLHGEIVALVKPQFEAEKKDVGKKGVVRDINIHISVANDIAIFAESIGLQIIDFSYSPIKGPEGNIEYLLYMKKMDSEFENLNLDYISSIIEQSHQLL